MPGAPNRPPETPAPIAPPPPEGLDGAARKALRRLVPSRTALLLDLWKSSVPADIYTPFARAEAAFLSKEYAAAENHLDQLAVRFAEPRWPTLPVPFRDLRVAIVAPMPPHWDPDHALAPPEKEAKRQRQYADTQLKLATATLEWMGAHAIAVDDLSGALAEASATLGRDGASDAFWLTLDGLWSSAYARLPAPTAAGTRPVAVPTAPQGTSAPSDPA
ncbi:MAG: hypothetical protein ACREDK_00510 [Thermoplasmata archaeon]